jgi:hypothetical protein
LRAGGAWVAAAFLVTVAIAVLGVSRAPGTPYDEAAHLDYIVKLAHGDMPQVFERYGQTVLRELACDDPRGAAWAGLEPCESDTFSPELAPFAGLSTATNYAPTYYLLTAAPYRLCEATSPWSPRVCGRMANTLWLGAAAGGFCALLLLLGASRPVSLVVSVGVSVLPAVLLQGITVNPDAAVHAMVAWLAVLAVRLARSDRLTITGKSLLLGAAGLVAVTTKETALVGLALVMLLLGFLVDPAAPTRRQVRTWVVLTGTLAGVVALAAASRLLQPVLRGTGGVNTLEEVSQSPLSDLDNGTLQASMAAMRPFSELPWEGLGNTWLLACSALVTVLAWAVGLQARLPVGAGAVDGRSSPPSSRARNAFPAVMVLAAWAGAGVLLVMTWAESGAMPTQPRYYMASAALVLAIGVATTASRPTRALVVASLGATTALVTISLLMA